MPDNDKTPLSAEATKLLAARKAAVEELKEIDGKDRPITDHDVVRVSSARLLVDALTLRMLAGAAVGPAEFKVANEMVDAALQAAGKRNITVTIEYVGSDEPPVCRACGHVAGDPVAGPEHKPLAATIDAEAIKPEAPRAETKTLPAPTPTPPAPPPKPLNPATAEWERQRGYVWGGASDGGLARGANWRAYAEPSDPHPFRDANGRERSGHPLPSNLQ